MKVRPSELLCILQVILEVILCMPWSRLGLIIINDPSWGMVIIGHGTFFSQPSKRCKFVKSHYIIGVLYITVLSFWGNSGILQACGLVMDHLWETRTELQVGILNHRDIIVVLTFIDYQQLGLYVDNYIMI